MNTGNPLQQEEKDALSGKAALVGSITQLEWRSDMQAKRKLPIGIQTFREIREQNHYYVDKTAYIRRLVDEGKHYFLSRPRRFGKSLLIDTLKELFEGNEPLFRGLVIHECWDWSMRYPVVRLSFGGGNFKVPGYLHTNLMAQLDAVERRTQVVSEYATGPERFAHLLEALHDRTGQPVAVLVDEYDKPILDALDVPEVARDNRDFLRGVYAVIKDSDAHVKFTLLTGVSKFSKVSLFSGLNNLTDITLSPRYSALCGYTDADLDTVFAPELPGLDRDDIRRWYNGYSWLGEEKVYNPFGILLLFFNRKFGAHWFETGTPTFLIDTLVARAVSALSLDGMLGSDALLSTFDVDHIATEALLFQTGYLTIQGEEDRGGRTRYRLGYPNREVRQSLNESLLNRLQTILRSWLSTMPGYTTCCGSTTSPAWRRNSRRSSPVSPTNGTRKTTLPTTRAITPACSILASRRWGWTSRWRTAAITVAWTWRWSSTLMCICSSSRWSSMPRWVLDWRNCVLGAMRTNIAGWAIQFT